jgi:hypothetical protein
MPKKGIIFQHATKINFENDGRKGKIECEHGGETTSYMGKWGTTGQQFLNTMADIADDDHQISAQKRL